MTVVRSRWRTWLAAGATLAAVLTTAPSAAAAAIKDTGAVPAYVRTIGGPGHASMYPSGLEYSVVGSTLVVADTGNNRVEKYDPATGAVLWSVGGYGTGSGKFNDPRDVGIDAAGNIYVADTGNSRIQKLDKDGNWLATWKGPTGDTVGSPIGISVSTVPTNGGPQDRVFIADGLKKKVRVWNTDLTQQVLTAVSSPGCTFSNIRDVDADSSGNMYVANYILNNILKLNPDGDCMNMNWGSKGTGAGQFKNPYGVRVMTDPEDGAERVYVADSNNNRIQVFSKNGTFIDRFGGFGVEDATGTFTALRRVAVSPDGDLWGADLWGFGIEHARVVGLHTDPGGAYRYSDSLPRVYSPPSFTSNAVFNGVHQIAFSNGLLLAMDTVNQRIVSFDPATGELIPPACGKRGWQPGAFNWPRGLAVDPATGRLWVADTKQSDVQIFDANCSFLQKMPATTTSADKFNYPYAVAMRAADHTAWVADTKNNRLKVYDTNTPTPSSPPTLLRTYGLKGNGIGQFNSPQGVAVDPVSGHILVADANNNRIVELSATPGADSITWLRSRRGFTKPAAIARDDAGRTFVADSGANRVVILGPGADWNKTADMLGTLDEMSRPEQVAVGPDGRIYVSDTYNDRILVYRYTT
jgi:DNA-binding beta-propeller fold protein YncE